MKYSSGDTVKFKLKSGELLEGEVIFVERKIHKDILYVNSIYRSNRWAYRVPEKKIISRVCKRIHSNEERSQPDCERKSIMEV
jgi:hypothetical protein